MLEFHLSDKPDRSMLRFSEMVQRHFKFLEEAYAFSCHIENSSLVRYETKAVRVRVFHGRISHEIGVEIGVAGAPNDPIHGEWFGLGLLIGLSDPELGSKYRRFQAGSAERVSEGVKSAAKLLECFGARALAGDPVIFARLRTERERLAEEYSLESQSRQFRTEASSAFRMRDYNRAASLYEAIRVPLSPAERKKLEYAKKKARGT